MKKLLLLFALVLTVTVNAQEKKEPYMVFEAEEVSMYDWDTDEMYFTGLLDVKVEFYESEIGLDFNNVFYSLRYLKLEERGEYMVIETFNVHTEERINFIFNSDVIFIRTGNLLVRLWEKI